MESKRANFNKAASGSLTVFLIFITLSANSQQSDLNFSVDPGFLKIPEGIYLKEIYDLAVNSRGEIWVLARGSHPVSKFNANGEFMTSFGEQLFSQVHSITMDPQDKIWITDVGLHTVFKLDEMGRVEMILGRQGKDGEFYTDVVPLFYKPSDVIVSNTGNIFVSDGYGNSRVVKFNQDGNFIKSWGIKGDRISEFNLPHSLAIDKKQRLLVADRENSRIQLFDMNGNYLETWNLTDNPYCIAIDGNDDIYITLGNAPKILKLDSKGEVIGLFGSEGKGPGQFVMPHGIDIGPDNDIYVAEPFNWRVEKFKLEY